MDVLFDQDWLTKVYVKEERDEAKTDAIAISNISEKALAVARKNRMDES